MYEQKLFSKLKKSNERIDSSLLRDQVKRTCVAIGQNHVYLTSGYLVQQILISLVFSCVCI